MAIFPFDESKIFDFKGLPLLSSMTIESKAFVAERFEFFL